MLYNGGMKKLGSISKYFQFFGVVLGFVFLATLRHLLGFGNEQISNSFSNTGLNQEQNTLPLANNSGDSLPVSGSVATPIDRPKSTSLGAPKSNSPYKDGSFTGVVADAYYGNVQTQVIVSNGRITNVNFLQFPNDNRTSQHINSQAVPVLQQEVLRAQSGNVNAVSGASATSQAFYQSISSALRQAQAT